MIRAVHLWVLLSLLPIAAAQPLEGVWRGLLGPGVIDLEIVVTFSADASGAVGGTIDIAAQGLLGYPLGVTREGERVTFILPGIPGEPVFDGLLAGDALTGTFTQGGQPLSFELRRGEAAVLRPQEPIPPFPYRAEEVEVVGGAVTLAGTLTLPEGEGPHPAALLITGSGPQDRDQTILGHKPFLVIADRLTREGFAVLRLDDRGVGGSGGSDALASYDDLAADALAAVAFLRAEPRVDPARIGLIGHSQGGMLAPLVAGRSEGSVAFVVLIAAPAVSGFDVLVAQNERLIDLSMRAADPNVSPGVVAAAVKEQEAFLDALRPIVTTGDRDAAERLLRDRVAAQVATLPADQRPDASTQEQIVAAEVDAMMSPVFRSFLTFDPQPYLMALTVPTLALFGDLDAQVLPAQNEAPMRAAFATHPDATVVTFPGLNHLMQSALTGSPDEYGVIAMTIDPVALDAIAGWVTERFGGR